MSRYVTLAGANFLSAIFGFFVAALLARRFGPAGFGAISLAATLASYAMVVSICGTDLFAVRTVAAGQNSLERVIPAVISIRLLLSIGVFIGLAICAFTIPQLYESRHLIVLFGLTLFSNALLLLWVPQAVHRSHDVAAATVLVQFLNLCLLYFFLKYDSSLHMAPIALIAAELIVAVGLILSIRRYVAGVEAPPDLVALVAMLRESAPIGMTQLMRAFALGSDLIILGLMSEYSAVGIYAAAFKLFLFMLSLGSAYFVILLPRISAISDSNKLIKRELKFSFSWALPLLASAVLVVWLSADFVIVLLFGAEYAGAANVLRVLSLAMVANIVAKHYRQVLLAKQMQQTDFKLSRLSAGVHLFAKILLIPFFGAIGCALGTLMGELFLMTGQRYVVNKDLSNKASA